MAKCPGVSIRGKTTITPKREGKEEATETSSHKGRPRNSSCGSQERNSMPLAAHGQAEKDLVERISQTLLAPIGWNQRKARELGNWLITNPQPLRAWSRLEKYGEWIDQGDKRNTHSTHSSWKQFQTFTILLNLFASSLSIILLEHDYIPFSPMEIRGISLIFCFTTLRFQILIVISLSLILRTKRCPSFPRPRSMPIKHHTLLWSLPHNYLHSFLYLQFLPMIWLFVSKFTNLLIFHANQNQPFSQMISSPHIADISASSFLLLVS